jgi:hypothetical protein
MPTLPVVVSTKRFEVPTSRLELTKRLSPVFATMFEVVMVPVILRLDSEPVGGSMAPAVRVNPEAITRLELMVTGEAPTILDAVKVPVIQESPTTCRGFSGSVVPMPTLDVVEMTKVFWSPTLDVFWGAVMKK